jgi:hypothetical protein
MKQTVFTILTCWTLVLGSALCFAGVLTHACIECDEEFACDHEEECADDPCGDFAMRPRPSAAPGPEPAEPRVESRSDFNTEWPADVERIGLTLDGQSYSFINLPLYEEGLPLLT